MPPMTADASASTETQFVHPFGPEDLGRSDGFKNRRAVSCAECRRLKLKCDRRLPCSSCSKRGCAAICPNGTLAAGPGKRLVLADTQHLHEMISQMGKRIAELEDALAALQAQVSHDKHPLLSDEFLSLKTPFANVNVTSSLNATVKNVSALLGTLTIGDHASFVGPTADADYFFDDSAQDSVGASSALPLEILLMANTFPMTSVREMQQLVTQQLSAFVPTAPDAWELSELFYKRTTWMFDLITKEEFVETIFSVVYASESPSTEGITPHDLGLMFMIFAIACMVDPRRPPYNAQGSDYYQLARVAIGMDSVIEHPTLQSVRAILMMSNFVQMCDHPNSATTCYNLLGLNSQLCQALGLHRIDTQWNLSESEREKRRLVFWEVVRFDACISLSLGRPPCFSATHVDAKLPEHIGRLPSDSDDRREEQTFRAWWFQFTQGCLLNVMDQAFGVAPLTYATVLRLDRLIREHRLSENLKLATVITKEKISEPLAFQRTLAFTLTQKLLLNLHRTFLALAMQESPEDPLKDKHAQSVLAAFRSAVYITSSVRALYSQTPLSIRFHMFWTHAFSASMLLGGIVVRSPGSGLAPAAWAEFDRVYNLFEDIGSKSRRIARMLPNMRKMHQSAKRASQAYVTSKGTQLKGGLEDDLQGHERVCIFKHFFGSTRVVIDSTRTTPSQSGLESRFSPASTAVSGFGSSPAMPVHIADTSWFASTPPHLVPLSQRDSNEIFSTQYPLGLSPALQQPPNQLPTSCQWSFEDWMASLAPLPVDGSFTKFNDIVMGDANASSTSTLPVTSSVLPPTWGDWSLDASEGLLPGQSLDESWQRFMDGIGLSDDAPVEH